MENREMVLFGNKVFGVEVSKYGLANGYLDYHTLAQIVGDLILNNTIVEESIEDWELVAGDNLECDIFQYYMITESGYTFLKDYTDELVFYNDRLNVYLWGITHFGTSWDYVLTDIKLVEV